MKGITFLLVLVLTIYSAEAGKELNRVDGSCISNYYISHEKLDYGQSRKYCQNLGGDLVTINGPAEQKFLFDALKKANYGNAFIGYNDIMIENKFVWWQGKSSYKNWCKGAPQNYRNEDCTEIVVNYAGCWNDIDCTAYTKRHFICEKR